MSKPPAILLDADMVLVDYIGQFVRYLAEVHGIEPKIPFSDESNYDLVNMYPQLAGGGLRPYIESMAVDKRYYGSIPFIPGAYDGVQKLRETLPGTALICVTSAGSEEITHKLRRTNLEPFKLDDIICLPLRASKKDVLSQFAPGCWFVDDLPRYIADADEVGLHSILFHQNYNTEAKVKHRARDWSEVVSLVTSPIVQPLRKMAVG